MSFGLYRDDYLSDSTVCGNLAYRAYNGRLHLHGGWNNTIENNIFVDGALSQVRFSNLPRNRPTLSGATGKDAPGTGEWARSGLVLRHDILVSMQPQAKLYAASSFEDRGISETARNLAWNQGRPLQPGIPGGGSDDGRGSWQAAGRDVPSLVADPLFVDPGPLRFWLCRRRPV